MSDYYEKGILRISKIRWDLIEANASKSTDENQKNEVLVREYLRRMAVFLAHIQKDMTWPFISTATAIGINIEIDLERFLPENKNSQFTHIRALCRFYLEWCICIDENIPLATKFMDIYEPFIMFLERGGGFKIRQRILWIGKSSFQLQHGLSVYVNETITDM